LARFNVQLVGFDKDYFNGLPIPAQAMALCTFMLQYYGETGLSGWAADALAPIVIVLSLLMVSRIKYDTLPKLTKKQNPGASVENCRFCPSGFNRYLLKRPSLLSRDERIYNFWDSARCIPADEKDNVGTAERS